MHTPVDSPVADPRWASLSSLAAMHPVCGRTCPVLLAFAAFWAAPAVSHALGQDVLVRDTLRGAPLVPGLSGVLTRKVREVGHEPECTAATWAEVGF